MIWRALGQNKCCYCNYLNLIASFLGYFAEEGYCNGIKKVKKTKKSSIDL